MPPPPPFPERDLSRSKVLLRSSSMVRATPHAPGARSPDLRSHVPLAAHDDVHHRAIEEVGGRVNLRAHPAPVEVPPLVELLLEHVEKVVLLDSLDDLLLVVERDVGGNRPGKSQRLRSLFVGHRSVLQLLTT